MNNTSRKSRHPGSPATARRWWSAPFCRPSGMPPSGLNRSPSGRRSTMGNAGLGLERLEARQLLAADPMITEFVARNDAGLRDGDGRSSDWVEIYNGGDEPVDLQGYHLTNDATDLTKWTFPSETLQPGSYLVVFASGRDEPDYVDRDGGLHTNFTLRRGGDYLALVSPNNRVVSEYGTGGADFPEQLTNVSYGVAQSVTLLDGSSPATYWVPASDSVDGRWTGIDFDPQAHGFASGTAAIGYEARPDDRTSFVGAFDTALPPGPHAVYARIPFDLNDATAITNLNLRLQYDNGFVAYLNGVKVAEENAPPNPGWFSTALTSSRRDSAALEFVDFDLSQHTDALVSGTNVLALHGLNQLNDNSDMLLVPELNAGASDLSAAVGVDPKVGYITTPTPGQPNVSPGEIFSGFVADTRFTVDRGFYNSPQQVEITSETLEAQIYYTTDGSPPSPTNPTATQYTGPLTIDSTTTLRAAAYHDDFVPTNVDTQTYLFVDDVPRQDDQFTLDAGFPERWGSTTADYGMDPDVISEVGEDVIKQGLTSIPTLSVAVLNDDLFGPDGIYTRTTSGAAYEKPMSVELVHPDGAPGFQIDAGIRIQGGAFRSHGLTKKHSFRFLFKSEYGSSTLDYPLFGEDAVQQFDTLTLRMESNDGWQWDAAGGQPQYARDEFHRRTQLAMGQPSPHGMYAHLYINGIYWGLYDVVERPDDSFGAAYFGADKDNWDGFNAGFGRGDVINADGDRARQDRAVDAWNAMMAMTRDVGSARTEEQRTAALLKLEGKKPDGTNDPSQEAFLDLHNYIDYLIVNHWGGNTDWPHKNFYVGRENSPDSEGFKFFSWDAEWSLTLRNSVRDNRINVFTGVQAPLQNLMGSQEFQMMFADHVHRHFFNGGPLYVDPDNPDWDPDHPERNVPAAQYVEITNEVFDALVDESARWGDQHRSRPYTRDVEWQREFDKLMRTWFPDRSGIVLDQYRRADLYPAIDAPEFNQHGGPIPSGFRLTMDNPGREGTLLYTLDGSDPRLIGGDVAPGAIVHDGSPIPLTGNVHVKSRVLLDGQWSALNEATFFTNDLRITEINYNPHDANPVAGMGEADVDHDEFEFIELTNTSSQPLDLTGVEFSRGIDYTFADATMVAPGSYVLVVQNQDAFESRYGTGLNIVGEFANGQLADGGEQIELRDGDGNVLVSVAYGTDGAWPAMANGRGSSLELIDPRGSTTDPANWTPSAEFGGSPGRGPAAVADRLLFSEILSNPTDLSGDMLELQNTSGNAIDLSRWYISDSSDELFKFQLPAGTSIAPFGYQVFTEGELGFGLDAARGGDLWLVESDQAGRPLSFAATVSFGATPAGVSIGPWPDHDSPLVPLAETTFGGANTGPRVGDLVISEVHYRPEDPDGSRPLKAEDFRFIELHNHTDQPVDLSGWRLSGSVQFTFDSGMSVAPGESLVVVPFAPDAGAQPTVFQFTYGISSSVPLAGPFTGDLTEDPRTVRLEMPGSPAANDPSLIPLLVVDEVTFDVVSPWPSETNGPGKSLTRTRPSDFGNLATSWTASDPSPGAVDFVMRLPGDANEDGRFDQMDITAVLQTAKYRTSQPASWSEGDWNGDGVFDELDIVAALQSGRYLL